MTVLGFHVDPKLKIFIYSYLDMYWHIRTVVVFRVQYVTSFEELSCTRTWQLMKVQGLGFKEFSKVQHACKQLNEMLGIEVTDDQYLQD